MSKLQNRPAEADTALFDLLTTAVMVLDADLRITRFNAAAQALLASSAAKLLGMRVDQLLSGADEFVGAARRALIEGRSFTEHGLDLRFRKPATTVVDCSITPLWDGHRDPVGVLIELTNVERHQHIKLEGNMSFHNNASRALLAGLAHEIKNPLGGIRGSAQLLERELEDQRLTEYTQVIIGETDRLRNLVDQMLGPRGESHRAPVNIHDVLEHVRLIVDAERGGNAAIVRDYDPSLPQVHVDRDQVVQALLNLVRNAVQATEACAGEVTLRTRIHRKFTIGSVLHRLVVRVDVVDTGSGVDPELSNSIFLPMVSGHASGSGLGLPIAQSLIQRQDGLIGFESEPGLTTFSVWLPLGAEQ